MAILAPTGGIVGWRGCEEDCVRFLLVFLAAPVRVGLEGGALSVATGGLEGGSTPGLLLCGVLGFEEGLVVVSGPLVSSLEPLLLLEGVAAFSPPPLFACFRFSDTSVFGVLAWLPGVMLLLVFFVSPLSAA